MASNRPSKHVPVDLLMKLEILQRIKNGESARKLGKIYHISRTSINDIKKNGDKLEKYRSKMNFSDDELKKRIRLPTSKNKDLDEALYLWCVQSRSTGTPIYSHTLIKKALELNARMKGNPEFKASDGWLRGFIRRHGISNLNVNLSK